LFSTIFDPFPPKRFSRASSRYSTSKPVISHAAPSATMLRMIAPPASSASVFSGTSTAVISSGISASHERSPS